MVQIRKIDFPSVGTLLCRGVSAPSPSMIQSEPVPLCEVLSRWGLFVGEMHVLIHLNSFHLQCSFHFQYAYNVLHFRFYDNNRFSCEVVVATLMHC